MARLARVVAPGVPHHVTQRGNHGEKTFFGSDDYAAYLELMGEWCGRAGVAVWAYCLMPNHLHLIAVPAEAQSLRRGIGEAHRRYSRRVNARRDRTGHLWQGRFASFPMDQPHLLAAARYVELNPVRAGLAKAPEAWRWSSHGAHLAGRDDGLVTVAPLLELVGDWARFIGDGLDEAAASALRRHESTGRPLGGDAFVDGLEKTLRRVLRPRPAGRPRKTP